MGYHTMAYIAADTTALDADGVCQSQTPASGGVQSLTINGAEASGGTATFTAGRVITVASVGNDLGRTFTVTGTDVNGDAQTEAITGSNAGTATGTLYFRTVTAVTTDDDTAAAVTVGMNNSALDVVSDGRCRITGLSITCSATAGSVSFTDGGATGALRLQAGTVASATAFRDISIGDSGILCEAGAYIAYTAGTTVFSNMTVFYEG